MYATIYFRWCTILCIEKLRCVDELFRDLFSNLKLAEIRETVTVDRKARVFIALKIHKWPTTTLGWYNWKLRSNLVVTVINLTDESFKGIYKLSEAVAVTMSYSGKLGKKHSVDEALRLCVEMECTLSGEIPIPFARSTFLPDPWNVIGHFEAVVFTEPGKSLPAKRFQYPKNQDRNVVSNLVRSV